jgi:hypothetical protein
MRPIYLLGAAEVLAIGFVVRLVRAALHPNKYAKKRGAGPILLSRLRSDDSADRSAPPPLP